MYKQNFFKTKNKSKTIFVLGALRYQGLGLT